MSYQVLARKWRPHDFESMAGQEHVLRALIHALDNQRLHHAYLFTGIQGIGKTTVARILAKCLNCESGISSKPCGKCSACQDIDSGRFIDLIEVDAASRTKVEDTRELLENVQYAPTRGRFKIYLIDEVHMLSGHSFNALLKTLEEPPEHVKFLLATTDPQKLPVTVLSRCLQFNLKKLSSDRITSYLQSLLKKESIPYEDEAIWQIARSANGSMRDSLSLLDQAIAFTQGELKEQDVSTMLGTIDHNQIELIMNALAKKNGKEILKITAELSEQAADFTNVLEDLIAYIHQIAIAQIIPDAIDQNNHRAKTILELSQIFSKEDVQLFYQIAIIGRRDLPLSNDLRNGFEMILLRMLAFQPVAITKQPAQQPTQPQKTITQNQPVKKPSGEIKIVEWENLLSTLQISGMVHALASNCVLTKAENNLIELSLSEKHSALLNDNIKTRLNEALNQHFNQTVHLKINIEKKTDETPAEKNIRVSNEHHQSAVDSITNDPNVQNIIEKFGATIDPNLIKSVDD